MKRGFSYIEIVVVIAIIGLVVSAIVASIQHVKIKNRDARRLDDISKISKALEFYYTENYTFPKSETEIVINGTTDPLSLKLNGMQEMPTVPTDPLSPNNTYKYWYQTNTLGTTYVLRFCLESSGVPDRTQGCDNKISP